MKIITVMLLGLLLSLQGATLDAQDLDKHYTLAFETIVKHPKFGALIERNCSTQVGCNIYIPAKLDLKHNLFTGLQIIELLYPGQDTNRQLEIHRHLTHGWIKECFSASEVLQIRSIENTIQTLTGITSITNADIQIEFSYLIDLGDDGIFVFAFAHTIQANSTDFGIGANFVVRFNNSSELVEISAVSTEQ